MLCVANAGGALPLTVISLYMLLKIFIVSLIQLFCMTDSDSDCSSLPPPSHLVISLYMLLKIFIIS